MPGGTVHSPEPPPLSGTGQSTGRKPRSHPGIPCRGTLGEPWSTEPHILHPSGAQHPLLQPAPAPAQDKPITLPRDPIPGRQDQQDQHTQSVPRACPALQAPAALHDCHVSRCPGAREHLCVSPQDPPKPGVFGHRDSHPELGDTHAGAAFATRGTRHAPISLLSLDTAGRFEGCLQLGAVPAEGLGGGRESGAPQGAQGTPGHDPQREDAPSPHSHLQHFDVPLGHDGQRTLEEMQEGRGRCPHRGRGEQDRRPWGSLPRAQSLPTRSPAGPGSPGKPLCPGIP